MATVRELISGPEKWTQNSGARNIGGRHVVVDSPDAVRWCLFGGLAKVYHQNNSDPEIFNEQAALLEAACYRLFETYDYIKWQDAPETTWEMVDRLLDEAKV